MTLRDVENYADLHGGVTGDSIRAAADDPNQNAIVITALAGELAEDEQHGAGDIEGDIEAGTRANPQGAQQVATSLAQAVYYAVGLLNDDERRQALFWTDHGLSEEESFSRDEERYDSDNPDVPDLPLVNITNPYDDEHDEIGTR